MLQDFITRQIDTAMAQLPEPPAGYHYVPKVGDIVYNAKTNDWSYDINFRLEADESEDERTRKEIRDFILYKVGHLLDEETEQEHRFVTYLEKQKEIPMPNSTELIEMWDEEKAMLKGKDFRGDTWRIAYNAFMDGFARGTCVKFEKQKEQKPAEFPLKDKVFSVMNKLHELNFKFELGSEEERLVNEITSEVRDLADYSTEKPAEWSEEDEKRINAVIELLKNTSSVHPNYSHQELINCLVRIRKSLRPQSKDEIYKEKDEAFKLGKHQLAIKFMNYLDENRPEGKMSLSNSECEDIDKAFKENDWKKIMRYANKYSWKPSEEQISGLECILGMLNPDKLGQNKTAYDRCIEMLKHLKAL